MTNKTVMFYALLLISGALCAMDSSASSASVAPTASEQHAALITAIRAGDTARVQALVAQGVDIYTNEKEAAREALKLKGPIKWEILELLQDPEGTIKCTICYQPIDQSLPDDDPQSLIRGGHHKLFMECREEHCFHANCIGLWVRRCLGTTVSCPYCMSTVNTESHELARIHAIPPELQAIHENAFLNAIRHNDIHTMQQEWRLVSRDSVVLALYDAIAYNHFEAVQWLVEHNFPIQILTCKVALGKGNAQIIAYLRAHCSWKIYWEARLEDFAIEHPFLLGGTIGAAIGIPLTIALHKLLDRYSGRFGGTIGVAIGISLTIALHELLDRYLKG